MDGTFGRGVQAQGAPQKPYGKKAHGAQQGAVAKVPGGGGADENAVPHEGGAADERHQQQPGQELAPGFHHRSVLGHQAEDGSAAQAVEQHEERRHHPAPKKGLAHGGVHAVLGAFSNVSARKRLSGIGKTVREIAEEHQKLHEDGAHGQQQVPIPGRQHREPDVHRNHPDRPQEQVPVQREERPRTGRTVFVREAVILSLSSTGRALFVRGEVVAAAGGEEGVGEAAPLGQDRPQRHAGKAQGREPCQAESQRHGQQHVEAVHQKIGHHGAHGILQADEPALESEEGKRSGCGPDADVEVPRGQFPNLRGTVHHQESQLYHHPLQRNERQPGQERHAKRPPENPRYLSVCTRGILCTRAAISLGREAARSHPQETEVPVQEVKEHGAYGDAADERRRRAARQMPRHGHVHHPHQGHGDVGQDAGNRQPEYVFVKVHRNFLSSSSMPR